MPDFETTAPWDEYMGRITEIYFDGSVTSIGANALKGATSLTSFIIPETITSIGANAFDGSGLTGDMRVPATVESIGNDAFANTDINTLYIYNGRYNHEGETDTINDASLGVDKVVHFMYGANIGGNTAPRTSMVLLGVDNNGVAYIDGFGGSSGNFSYDGGYEYPEKGMVDKISPLYKEQVYKTDNPYPYGYKVNKLITKAVIGDGVNSLSGGLFAFCENLTELEIPGKDIKALYGNVFMSTSIDHIVLPENITTVGPYSFGRHEGVGKNPSMIELKYDGDYTLAGLTSEWPDDAGRAYDKIFCSSDPASPSDVVIIAPKSSNIEDYAEFTGYTYIDSSSFGKLNTGVYYAIKDLGANCKTLQIFGSGSTLGFTNKTYDQAPWYGQRNEITNVEIKGGITGIGSYGFAGLENVTGIRLCSGLESIGAHAFYDAAALRAVSIPASVSFVGDYAFALSDANTTTEGLAITIGNTDLTLNDTVTANRGTGTTVTAIDDGNCGTGDKCIYADNVTYILYSDGTIVLSGTGKLGNFRWNGEWQPWAAHRDKIKKVVYSEGITNTGAGTFAYCTKIEEAVFASSMTSFEPNAFMDAGTEDFDNIVIPDSVTSIGSYAFGYYQNNSAASITSVTIMNPEADFTSLAFNGNSSVPNSSVTVYTRNNGLDCKVKQLAEAYGYKYIDLDIYSKGEDTDSNLRYEIYDGVLTLSPINAELPVTIPTGDAQTWKADALGDIDALTGLVITAGISDIPASAFENYTALETVELANTVRSIGEKAFAITGSGAELELTIPKAVETISDTAFDGRKASITSFFGTAGAEVAGNDITNTVKKTFKILLIGNSYSEDASDANHSGISHTYEIYKSICGDEVEVEIGLMASGGKTLAWHATRADDDLKTLNSSNDKYYFRIASDVDNGLWHADPSIQTIKAAMAYDDWDIITLQPYQSESNTGTATKSDDPRYFFEDKYQSLSQSIPYFLDLTEELAPQAKVYYYMHWAEHGTTGYENAAETRLDGYMKNAAMAQTALLTYTGVVNTDKHLTGVIPVGTAIQNARGTYLTKLTHATAATSGLENDPVYGLQRDGGHLSYNVGRYINALTFAYTLMPAEYINGDPCGIRDSQPMGQLPAQYSVIGLAAAKAAVANPYAVTALDGYDTDPVYTIKSVLESAVYSDEAWQSVAGMQAAIDAQLAALTGDLSDADVVAVVSDLTVNGNETGMTATFTLRYGYTSTGVTLTRSAADAGTTLVGGTSEDGRNYSESPLAVDGTDGNTVYLAYTGTDATLTDTQLKTLSDKLGGSQKILDVVGIDLYIKNGTALTKVENAKLSETVTAYLPYETASADETYYLYHWNGNAFDGAVDTTVELIDGKTYLVFDYDRFSPFAVVGTQYYYGVTVSAGEGYDVVYTTLGKDGEDYTFTVNVKPGYTLQSVTANGSVFTEGGAAYIDNGDGTYTIKALSGDQNIIVTVTADPVYKNVEYDGNYSPTPEIVGSAVTVKDAPDEREGQTFIGWRSSFEGTVYLPGDSFIMPNVDVAMTSQWQDDPAVYTVSYDANGSTDTVDAEATYVEGALVTVGAAVTKEGAQFIGWRSNVGGTVYQPGDRFAMPAGDVTLTAQWQDDPTEYTVSYNANGGTGTLDADATYVEGAYVTVGAAVTKDGFVFSGWRTSTGTVYQPGERFAMPATNITLTAQFEPEESTYTVSKTISGATYRLRSGLHAGDIYTITTPDAEKTGYVFTGWLLSSTGTVLHQGDSFNMPAANVVLTAQFEKVEPVEEFSVTYVNGSETSTGSFAVNSWVVVGDAPAQQDGKTFLGWKSDVDGRTYNAGDKFRMPDTNVTLTAQWADETWTITWVAEGATLRVDTVANGETPVYIGATPVKASTAKYDYTFAGWSPEVTAATADVTYTAQFTETVRKYHVTWINESSVIKTEDVDYGTVPTAPADPTKEGTAQYSYTFADWSPAVTPVTSNVTYYATYTRTENTFIVTWVNYDGSVLETDTDVEYDTMPSYNGAAPAKPADEGHEYVFAGWEPTLSNVRRDVTYTAKFDTVDVFTVHYDMNNADTAAIDDARYALNAAVRTADAPEREGYIFTGWLSSYESRVYGANATFFMPSTDVTLTAQWKAAVTAGSVYIVAEAPADGVYDDPYTGSLTARKNDATNAVVTSGVSFVLVDENGHALGTSTIAGCELTLNTDGSITGTPAAAGTFSFRVRLANLDGEFVSDPVELSVFIDKADGVCSVTINSWTYGEQASKPQPVSPTNGTDNVTYFYKLRSADDSAYTADVPTDAGEYTLKAVFATTANYKECSATCDFEIYKAVITSVSVSVTAPRAGRPAQTTIADGNGYTGTITWSPADAVFGYDTVYTATVTLTPDKNHRFEGAPTAEGWDSVNVNGDGTVTLVKAFERTELAQVEKPVIRPNGGKFTGSLKVSITCATDDAVILYTTDGSDPYRYGDVYTGSFVIKSTTEVLAVAVKTGYADSEMAEAYFVKRASDSGSTGSGSTELFTLTFKTNGGSRINSITAKEGTKITLSKYEPTRDGYTFAGWYLDKQLTDRVTKITLVEDTTVYAKWTANGPALPFTDVKETDWFYDDVLYVYENGLMKGTASDTFSPYATTTRGMIVTVLYRLEGEPALSAGCPFSDVASGSYYENAITWAAANGIVNGYGDGKFGPNDNITREQLAAIICRYAAFKGYDVAARGEINTFADFSKVDAWAVSAMSWAYAEGVIAPVNGLLDATVDATRAQAAAALHALCENVAE